MTPVEEELLTLPEHMSSLPVFSGVTRTLILHVCFVDRCLSIWTLSPGHSMVCLSWIYGFWLLLWYLQTFLVCFLLVIVLSVPGFTASDYSFGIFKLLFKSSSKEATTYYTLYNPCKLLLLVYDVVIAGRQNWIINNSNRSYVDNNHYNDQFPFLTFFINFMDN